jgi:hypothetical protein
LSVACAKQRAGRRNTVNIVKHGVKYLIGLLSPGFICRSGREPKFPMEDAEVLGQLPNVVPLALPPAVILT